MIGQTEIISIILILGIVLALTSSAYYWGVPLVEKRTVVTDVSLAEKLMLDLNDKIIKVANSGGGEESIDMQNGFVRVVPFNSTEPDNNSVVLEFVVQRQMVFPGTRVYLKTNNIDEVGIYGESEPRIITLESEPFGTGYKMRMKMRYRELDINATPRKGFHVALNEGKGVDTGNKRITVSFLGSETLPMSAKNGGDLIITHLNVVVV